MNTHFIFAAPGVVCDSSAIEIFEVGLLHRGNRHSQQRSTACHRHSVLDTIGWPNPPETRSIPAPTSAADQMDVLEAVLEPGDVLYIPPWWLCVSMQNRLSRC